MENQPSISSSIKQSNFLTDAIFFGMTSVQKDFLYFLQSQINFFTEDPQKTITIDFEEFLNYKKIKKNDFYTIEQTVFFADKISEVRGGFKNELTGDNIKFNLIDNVKLNNDNPNLIDITLASFGEIFLYHKKLEQYVEKSQQFFGKIDTPKKGRGYTQIEKNVVTLGSYAQKKLFEMLSRFKTKGWMIISLRDLKLALGFIDFVLKNEEEEISPEEKQLMLVFSKEEEENSKYKKYERLPKFGEFRVKFLDKAVKSINENEKLDIKDLEYETIKKGQKVVSLKFTFLKITSVDNFNQEEKACYDLLIKFQMKHKQVLYLMNRISSEKIFEMMNDKIEQVEVKPNLPKQLFDKETNTRIQNIGGFLYEKVFGEILKDQV